MLQIGEEIRDLGLEGQMAKKGTPTMGGFIILLSLIIPTLLFAKITNVYIVLLLTSAIWLGAVGFADDYIKVFKKNKDGLSGKFKIVGQIGLGLIVGLTMYFNQHIKVRIFDKVQILADGTQVQTFTDSKSLMTTVPFLKDNQFDYNLLLPSFIPDQYVWVVYVLVVIFIITAVSNGANITDGIDGLAAGTSVIIVLTLAILAYVSGNKIFSQYLNVMFIPNSGELAIFCAAFVGACIGFLWYNAYPAQVFMGDTGSLMLGGVIATLAIVIRKEMLIPVLCGIFLIENLSVILQVGYFKYTKKKYGEGRRIFLMSPLHHHFQKKNYHESKIVTRFMIVGIILAVVTLVTLKLR
jgi:phospho-N-acetylmuramoyl-pentapeptide-transferase